MQFSSMTVNQLKTHIKENNLTYSIPGYAKMRKDNLVKALNKLNKRQSPAKPKAKAKHKCKACSLGYS